jgi:hypothetical protein|tara:strand:- start:1569 stop:2153 length:585 start_codon:yes stop_codon:yes gene_type:complete
MMWRILFIGVFCFLSTGTAYAASSVLDAVAAFIAPGGILKRGDISFGDIVVSTFPTATGDVRLHPDGGIDTDIPEFTLIGHENAGHVEYFQDTGDIEIRCSANALLSNGSDLVRIDEIRIAFPTAAAWAGASACNGTAGAPAGIYDLSSDVDATLNIFIGARLRIDGANPLNNSGTYNSLNAGGTVIEIEVTLI